MRSQHILTFVDIPFLRVPESMKPDRKHLGVRVQQWAIHAVHAVAREYQLTYGEALEKIVATAASILLDGLKEPRP